MQNNSESTTLNQPTISLLKIAGFLWAKKIFIAVITVLFSLASVLLIIFINQSLSRLAFVFQYEYSTQNELTLPDGTLFRPIMLINQDFLEGVKASDPAFDQIDIDAILAEIDAISLTSLQTNSDSNIAIFRIEFQVKYFGGAETTRKFFEGMMSSLAETLILDETFERFFNTIGEFDDSNEDFTHIIPELNRIYNQLVAQYELLLLENPSLSVNGISAQGELANLRHFFTVNSFNLLSAIVSNNHFVRSLSAQETLRNDITALSFQRELVRIKIRTILDNIDLINQASIIDLAQLESLSIEEATLTFRIENLELLVGDQAVIPTIETHPEFISFYNSYINELERQIVAFNLFYRTHINSLSSVIVLGTTNGEEIGQISLLYALVGSLMVGFILGSSAAFALEYYRKKRVLKPNA